MMDDLAQEHRRHVIAALLAGEAVSVEVLADYPDLREFQQMRDALLEEAHEGDEHHTEFQED